MYMHTPMANRRIYVATRLEVHTAVVGSSRPKAEQHTFKSMYKRTDPPRYFIHSTRTPPISKYTHGLVV